MIILLINQIINLNDSSVTVVTFESLNFRFNSLKTSTDYTQFCLSTLHFKNFLNFTYFCNFCKNLRKFT